MADREHGVSCFRDVRVRPHMLQGFLASWLTRWRCCRGKEGAVPSAFTSSSDMLLGLSQPILLSQAGTTKPAPHSQLPGQRLTGTDPGLHRLLLIHYPEGDGVQEGRKAFLRAVHWPQKASSGNEDDRASSCLGGYRALGERKGAAPWLCPGLGLRPSPCIGSGPRPSEGHQERE